MAPVVVVAMAKQVRKARRAKSAPKVRRVKLVPKARPVLTAILDR